MELQWGHWRIGVGLVVPAGGPHIAAPQPAPTRFRTGPPAGYVRVLMSASPVLEAKRNRIYAILAVVFVAAIVSGLAGLYLAHRLRRPLNRIVTALQRIR